MPGRSCPERARGRPEIERDSSCESLPNRGTQTKIFHSPHSITWRSPASHSSSLCPEDLTTPLLPWRCLHRGESEGVASLGTCCDGANNDRRATSPRRCYQLLPIAL